MKSFVPLIAVLLLSTKVNAQYKISEIPTALKEGADMVIRIAEMEIQLKSPGNVQIRNKYVYSILNSSADKYSDFIAHYDKLNKVQHIEGAIYDADGNKIRSLKKSEIKDYSATSESDLADDNRVKYHDFNHTLYPYSIEYEIITDQEGLFHLPFWSPVMSEKIAVEFSKLKVIADAGYELRYKTFNYLQPPNITHVKKQKEYQWSISNYAAMKLESFSPSWIDITPVVFLAPSNFEMQRYSGEMTTWKNFGLFIHQLNEGRDVLPVNIKQQVSQITSGLSTTKEKVEALYKFMQKNTRYISIQLGIGGWQTLDANFVGKYGYGDCKALTNYMHALLKEAAVPSYPALIRAGRNEWNIIPDFSSNQFNHVILCVPNKKDTIWLECTSQTEIPGYLGSFTGNRKALLISPEGGLLVNTPVYKEEDNLQVRNIKAVVNEEGMLQANIQTRYSAIQQDGLNSILTNSSKEQVDEYMRTKFKLSYNVDNYVHKIIADGKPGIDESINLKVSHYASVSGKRLFINPNIVSISSFKLKDAGNRTYDFEMDQPFTDFDTVFISIPKGFKPESVPADVNIQLPNAQFRSAIQIDKEQIIYTRYFTQQSARIPAAKAKELADFFDKIYRADHARIVFVKEETDQ